MRRILCLIVGSIVLAACGDEAEDIVQRDVERVVADADSAAVQEFSHALASTPAWGSVRREAPSPERFREWSGEWILGELQDVRLGSIVEGGLTDAPDSPVVERRYIELAFTIDSASAGSELRSGSTATVPIIVWVAGPAAPGIESLMKDIETSLREALPTGVKAVVMVESTKPGGEEARLVLPGDGEYKALAAVTFQTTDHGLYSLDPAVGDSAEEYLAAGSLEALTADR